MNRRIFLSSPHALLVAFLGAAALTVGACSSSVSSTSTMQALPQNLTRQGASSPGSVSGYTIYTVDNPKGQPNFITGIDDDRKIVGVYGNGGSTSLYNSYTAKYHTPSPSQSPYPTFVNDDYPDAPGGTYITSLVKSGSAANKSIEAGYAITPGGYNGNLNGNWGVVDNKGIWTLIGKFPKAGQHCHHLELFEIDSNYTAVGLYWKGTGTYQGECNGSNKTQYAFEVTVGEKQYTDFPKLNNIYGATAPVATGVYESGGIAWIVGSTDSNGASSSGWTTTDGTTFNLLTFNNSGRSTQFYALNSSGTVAGTEEGAGGDWHGFTVSNLFSTRQPVWSQTINLGNNSDTVVSGINDSGDICGWYKTGDGNTHGFVGFQQ